jgi:DDE superfamily endonuclease
MLPSVSLSMPTEWRGLLEELAPVFARRSTHRLFMALACGLILADRGTVTGMAAAAGMGRQWRRACWFFASATWDPDALGLAVARLIVKYLISDGDPLIVAVDGTFFRRWGRHVAEARWAYDGAAQGGKKIASGNTWVIAALVLQLPCRPSPVALPVLFRLWRGKGTPSQVRLAADLTELLVKAFPGRKAHGTGDAASHGEPLVIKSATWTTRLPASAVIHEPKPPPTGQRGRPRNRGDRIGTCKDAAAIADWQDVTVRIYGKAQKVQAAAFPGLWYGSFGDTPGQLVLMREPDSGRPYDPGLFTLDKATPAAADMNAALRDALTQARINAISAGTSASRKTTSRMMTSEASAA